jgi:hypothetical protein
LVRFCYAPERRPAAAAEVIKPDFASVGSLLPAIGITKRRLKRLESVVLVREQRESGRQDLAYNARPFL